MHVGLILSQTLSGASTHAKPYKEFLSYKYCMGLTGEQPATSADRRVMVWPFDWGGGWEGGVSASFYMEQQENWPSIVSLQKTLSCL